MVIHVLLIDDDARLFELLERYLAPHDVRLTYASHGGEGLAQLEGGSFDAVFLDVMMPGLGGLDVLRRIRQKSQTPVVMLTARGDEADRVVGLEMGADDYVPKPFAPRELLARLRAVLRRTHGESHETIRVGTLTIDVPSRGVTYEGEALSLTAHEFALLVALASRAGRVVPRRQLLEATGSGHVSERTVDVHVASLRKKLGEGAIETVRGVGYVIPKR
ncbi:MAG: response regulator transcription factor [Myxococcota bacterium]